MEIMNKVPVIGKKFGLTRYNIAAKFKKVRFDGNKYYRHLEVDPPYTVYAGLEETFDWLLKDKNN